ncbi:MAG: hypothetical protein ACXABE_10180 [Candidatus Thorarchaeota archaeon]|jgi:hypothetical protein
MKEYLLRCTGLLIGLIFVFSLLPQSTAAVVWEDNFDDGNYDDWTVSQGSWNASNGYLEAVYGTDLLHEIWHNSSQIEGTWSFDIFLVYDSNDYGSIYFDFIVNGTSEYSFRVSCDEGNPVVALIGGVTLESAGLAVGNQTWTHFDITRNSTGGMNVYVNKTGPVAEPILTAIDTTHSISERFEIASTYSVEGSRVDNIVVKDTIDIIPPDSTTPTGTTSNGTTPPPLDTTLPIVIAGVVGVVIIAAVVLMRRR